MGRSRRLLFVVALVALLSASCGGSDDGPAQGADVDRPPQARMASVRFDNVADEVGLDFRHGAFQWGTTGDTNAMMSGGVCWIDADKDGWLDLFVVNTWSNGEWGRWRDQGLPSTRLYRNERGQFTDVTDQSGVALEVRGNGCVAADLDLDGYTDLYVTTERDNLLLWNDGGDGFEIDDGASGVEAYGWQTGAAVGDVNGDGWPDLFVAGYADLNNPVPTDKGFPNPFMAEPDFLFVSQGAPEGERPTFVDVASAAGIEDSQLDYGLGAVFSDVDRDGDLDLYVANDTQPNRLYVNEPTPDRSPGFHLEEQAGAAGTDDAGAGMGVASGDYDDDGRPDLVVTNMTREGHGVFRSAATEGSPQFSNALGDMGLADLGLGDTGWGTSWADLDLDGDLDLVLAHGTIPVTDLDADREQLRVYENGVAGPGRFAEATVGIGLDQSGRHLGRGMAAADYDNDGDVDLAVGTIGGDLALLRNTGAGGHWLLVAPEPATPGTRIALIQATGRTQERELIAGSSYLSSEDPRAHFGVGEDAQPVSVRVTWPDGTVAERSGVEPDQLLAVTQN